MHWISFHIKHTAAYQCSIRGQYLIVYVVFVPMCRPVARIYQEGVLFFRHSIMGVAPS